MRIVAVPPAGEPELLAVARTLMGEYGAMPHIDGRWTTVAADIAKLPQPYVAPLGALLVALDDDEPLACGALAPLEPPAIAELKRVYVRPAGRGRGVGEAMTRALMAAATEIGYTRVRLDTAPELHAAVALYERLGFERIAPYHHNADRPFLFFERMLP
jgi:ribosomal protein S18 acetylase RimI-like enzyme